MLEIDLQTGQLPSGTESYEDAATKYDAFLLPKGRVDLGWTIHRQTQRLRLGGTEKDGPSIRSPAKRSFGTKLIETLGRLLQGNVQLAYAESGLAYTLRHPTGLSEYPDTDIAGKWHRGTHTDANTGGFAMTLTKFRIDEEPHVMDGLRLVAQEGTREVEAFVSRKVMDVWAESVEHSGGQQSLFRKQYNALGQRNLAALQRIVSAKYGRGVAFNRQHPFVEVLFSDIAESGESLNLGELVREPLPPGFHRLS